MTLSSLWPLLIAGLSATLDYAESPVTGTMDTRRRLILGPRCLPGASWSGHRNIEEDSSRKHQEMYHRYHSTRKTQHPVFAQETLNHFMHKVRFSLMLLLIQDRRNNAVNVCRYLDPPFTELEISRGGPSANVAAVPQPHPRTVLSADCFYA